MAWECLGRDYIEKFQMDDVSVKYGINQSAKNI